MEDTKKKNMLNSAYRNVDRHLLGTCSQFVCLSVCLCSHPYESSYKFGVETWNYMMCEYDEDVE
jgi:hypothetical protein